MLTIPWFREEQRFRQPWLWLLILFLVALQWWGFIQQIVLGQPWGNRPAPDWMMVLLWLLMIGSQRADELAQAIAAAQGSA